MYRSRLTIFTAVAAAILLSIPAANLALRAYIGGALLPHETRDLWSVDRVEATLAYLLMSCCNRSMYPERVRIGQKGYLFLGNDYGNVIDKTTGYWRPPSEMIERRVDRFTRLQRKIEKAGATLAIVIAPNKHSIYPEMLPLDLIAAPQTVTDDLVRRAGEMNMPILDLRSEMRRLKSSAQAYLKTDTHWSHAGAAASYDTIMAFLRDRHGVQASRVTYNLTPVYRPAGDLTGILKMQEMFEQDHDIDYRITMTPRAKTCVATINLLSGDTGECEAAGNGEVSVMDKFMKVTRTSNAPNDQTVLMLCDSFCSASSALFNASFDTVYRVHWSSLDSNAIKRYLEALAPDIVILQMVERDALSFPNDKN